MTSLSIDGYHWTLFSSLERAAKHYQQHWKEFQKVQPKDIIPGTTKVFKIPLGYPTAKYALEDARLRIYLLSATCVEALANYYLSFKTNAEQFTIFEKANPVEKWVAVPRLIIPTYRFPKNGSLYQVLKKLIKIRNDIVHPKPLLYINQKLIHKGKPPKYEKEEKVHDFTLACVSLPIKLAKHLAKYDKTEAMDSVFHHSGVDPIYNSGSLENIKGEEKWLKEHGYKRSNN